MSNLRQIAALCVARNSVYKKLAGVDCYDMDRDAKTFTGGMPVVGHPPCRLWSAYCAHQAKSPNPEEEKALGVWVVGQISKWGGVLEQPAHSRLFDACDLPHPGRKAAYQHGFSIELPQYWFGNEREKNTWLWFSRIAPWNLPEMPFRLKPEGGDRRIWQLMSSRNERERTPKQFAEWLVECARRTQ